MPNFKDVLQKLSVFKNNLSLLVPVIIALVSVLLFIPTQLMSSKLKKDVEQESINKGGRRIASLEKSAVSSQQYEMEAERQKAHAADANEIAKLVMQGTQRELLSYDIFPAPDPNGFSGLIFQEFGQNYRSGIDKLVLSVNGRDCPTDAEIQRGLEGSSSRSRTRGRGASMMSSSRMSLSGGYSGMDLYGGGSMRVGNIERMILDEMCKDRAKSVSTYVNPADVSGYEYWADYTYEDMNDAVEDCFYHQLAYWIIDDIFQTIATMNSGHENVLMAPAKRFMGITFTMGLKRPGSGGGGVFRGRGRRGRTAIKKSDDADRPAYVREGAPGLSESCTGRYCSGDDEDISDDIDITHFNFSVIVSTKSILPFMKELCSVKEHQFRGYPDPNQPVQTFKHNQITILESKMGSINSDDFTHRYYRYGDESVVSLDLICEYIFNVESYDILIPQPVRDTLAGKDEDKKK